MERNIGFKLIWCSLDKSGAAVSEDLRLIIIPYLSRKVYMSWNTTSYFWWLVLFESFLSRLNNWTFDKTHTTTIDWILITRATRSCTLAFLRSIWLQNHTDHWWGLNLKWLKWFLLEKCTIKNIWMDWKGIIFLIL